MAYDSPASGRHGAGGYEPEATTRIGFGDQTQRGQGGFREEPDLRTGRGYGSAPNPRPGSGFSAGTGYQPGYQTPAGYDRDGEPEGSTAVSAAELEDVFGEPDGDRDRLAVHWLWEAVLLIGLGALAFLLWQAEPAALRGDQLSLLLILMAGFGLLGLAAGLSLRAGVPNLAIGPVALGAGVYFAQHGDDGVLPSTGVGLLAAVVLGAAVAVLVAALHVPAWAASLGAVAAAVVWLRLQPDEIPLAGGYDPRGQAAFLVAAVAALGILGGLVATLRGVRRAFGRVRPTADPARRTGLVAALVATGALVVSMALAAGAGVLLVAGQGATIGPGGPVEAASGVTWLTWTVVGFGVALVGGTSAFGRRGGVFGTVLAALALVLFQRYQATQGWEIALLATAGVAVAAGLVVTRMVETFGRPRAARAAGPEPVATAAEPAAEWQTTLPTRIPETSTGRHAEPAAGQPRGGDAWPSPADSWSSALPGRAAAEPDPWDDRWGRR